MNVFEELMARNLIAQMTHPDEVKNALTNEKIAFYIGFDATADSLHVGSLLQLITAKRLQNAGHKPILLVGGATTKIGDPSGKTDMRKMLTDEQIAHNIDCFKVQFAKIIDLKNAMVVNNADWIESLSIPDFIRLGFNFNINTMLAYDCYANRRETGLTLGEMCYMPMQGMDFLHLYQTYNCRMQLGGNDQWANIIGGVELVRKQLGEKGNVFGMTFNLLTTSEGKKMGKTEKGAIWLSSEKTSPYDLYQYFRNVEDSSVINCLKMLTFIPLDEIAEMEKWEGAELNTAKKLLAFEIVKIVHGENEAQKAQDASAALFATGGNLADMPTFTLSADEINILDLLVDAELAPSKSEARRLIQGGGIALNDEIITSCDLVVTPNSFTDCLIIRKGKKTYKKVEFL